MLYLCSSSQGQCSKVLLEVLDVGAEMGDGAGVGDGGGDGFLLTHCFRFYLEECKALNGCVPGGQSDGYISIMIFSSTLEAN